MTFNIWTKYFLNNYLALNKRRCDDEDVMMAQPLKCYFHITLDSRHASRCMHRRQSWRLGSRPPHFWMGVVGSPLNIIISHNVQEYDMRILSKSDDLS